MKKQEVVTAINELNEVLGLEPQIVTKDKGLAELKALVFEVCALVEPEDDISEKTKTVLESIVAELKTPEPEPEPEEEEEGEEEEEEEEEEEATVAVTAILPPQVTPTPPTRIPMTRLHAIGLALRDNRGKIIRDIAKVADEIYVEHDGSSNFKESERQVVAAIKILVAFGAIVLDRDIVK